MNQTSMLLFRSVVLLMCLLLTGETLSQITINGIVVDSVTLQPLAGTNIMMKASRKGIITDSKGSFSISVNNYDTMMISRVGYETSFYPVFMSETDVMFLLREEVQKLQEVVVDVYEDERPIHSAPRPVKKLTVGDAFVSPFTYFSRAEKEKRVLVRFQNEQQKVQVFVDLITRVQFRHEVMNQFNIDEESYYEILIHFNTTNREAHYLKDEEEIRKVIYYFFEQEVKKND